MNEPPPTPKRHGCFFYGCISLIVLMLVGATLAVVLVLNAPKILNRMAGAYTETAPVQLEKVEVSPAELDALQKRIAKFQQSMQDQAQPEELVLSAHDINALIGNDPSLKDIKDKLFVAIDGNRIKGQVSWPLEDLGPLKLKGRYLNGEVAFRLSLGNGVLGVFVEDIRVKGRTLPGPLLSKFKGVNLAEDVQRQPENAAAIQKFETIKIENGKVILRSKAKP